MDEQLPLTRTALVVEDVSWRPKVVRTGGASGPLHEEWTLAVRLSCETQLVRAVAFLDAGEERCHSRGWADHPANTVELMVSFVPDDWSGSDLVQINSGGGGIRLTVKSAALKTDPRSATTLHFSPGDVVLTGSPIKVLTIAGLNISAGVLVVGSTDTKTYRTRWRVRSDRADSLGEFSFLATGRRSGTTTLPP